MLDIDIDVTPTCTGLAYDDDGTPWLVYSDGTRLRPIAGGDGSDEGDTDDGDDDDQGDDDTDDKKKSGDDDDLGDDEKTDWRAEAEKWKKLSRKNERAAKAARREADEAKKTKTAPPKKKTATDSDDEDDTPDPEQIREEARKEAQRDALRDRALDRVEAKAGKLFKDPEDARLHLAKSVEDFIDGDEIDTDAITEALDQLLTDKPHLAASKRRFNGDGDGGARKDKPKKATSLTEAVERRMTGKT